MVEQRGGISAFLGKSIADPRRILGNPVHVEIFAGDGRAALIHGLIVDRVLDRQRILGNFLVISKIGPVLPHTISIEVAEVRVHTIGNGAVRRGIR